MKKIWIALMISVLGSCALFAQQDCGAIDCPGRCGRFVDNDGDGFCDHGRLSAPVVDNQQELKESSAARDEAAETETTPDDSKVEQHREQMAQPRAAAADDDSNDNISLKQKEEDVIQDNPPTKPIENRSPYSLILISALTLGLYAISFILVKTNVLKKATHRKIWNILLLITGLTSCLLGFFLVIQINYNLKMDWLWTVKLYHVQFGIAMTIIAVIHILWHWNYWKSILKR